jgi:hypothetical protein
MELQSASQQNDRSSLSSNLLTSWCTTAAQSSLVGVVTHSRGGAVVVSHSVHFHVPFMRKTLSRPRHLLDPARRLSTSSLLASMQLHYAP